MTQGERVGLMIDGWPDFLYIYIGDRPTLEQDQRSQIVVPQPIVIPRPPLPLSLDLHFRLHLCLVIFHFDPSRPISTSFRRNYPRLVHLLLGIRSSFVSPPLHIHRLDNRAKRNRMKDITVEQGVCARENKGEGGR